MSTRTDDEAEAHPLRDRRPPFDDRTWTSVAGIAIVALSSLLLIISDVSPAVTFAIILAIAVAVGFAHLRIERSRDRAVSKQLRRSAARAQQSDRELQTLKMSAEQATLALTKMRDGVIMLSPLHEILVINPWARRLLVLSSEGDLRGRRFREVVRIPELVQAVDAAFGGTTPQKLMLEIVDGVDTRPVKVRVDRVTPDDETNLLMTLRDETESQQIESIRREFIANLSHEIKTPLSAIKGYAETVELAIADDPEAAIHFMSQIRGQCVRLERLVADMMQLARAQSGRSNLNLTTVSLANVVAESLRSYRPVAEAHSIEICVDEHLGRPADGDPVEKEMGSDRHPFQSMDDVHVMADHEAVLTIVNNLVGNAVRYTPQGGRVRLSCRRAEDRWILSVSDTGVGIAADEQKRIFERFYRGERGRESSTQGTGIGLSIVKNLTAALGGEVRLESSPGKGATFDVSLPAATVEPPHAKS
ncbi:sensor histidine kinase [Novipirellula artificiosorum]|uniref:histidine kinase n=1 Tax=Novipirellula artificiosorum TaxID=2528016 RepID=A0A5C6E109_9BACT|nr:ATP-binding protein [Novipirellula artificiosorum]TWU42405.1 Signal-transduction histidine kinase senX3 [Novipirellula artificiosorum]